MIISVSNQKGGVGKTTTTMNLGVALTLAGMNVLLIDLDPQSDLSKYVGFYVDSDEGIKAIDEKPTISDVIMGQVTNKKTDIKDCIRHSEVNHIDYIPCDLNLANADLYLAGVLSRETLLKRMLNNEVIKGYDYVLIDCNPSLGVLLMNALTASNGVIIPVQTQEFAYDKLKTLTDIIEEIKNTINPELDITGILATMVDNTNESKKVIEKLTTGYGDKLFSTVIHRATQATTSSRQKKSLCLFSKSKLGDEYKALADELISNE